MESPAAMEQSFRWRFHRSGISAASLIGRGMVFPGVSNGARASCRGVPTNVGILRTGLFPSFRAACKAPSGLRNADFGRITAMSRAPATLFSLIGTMKAVRTDYPIM